jgi:anhydro-N-acetylmuramic acid kinase
MQQQIEQLYNISKKKSKRIIGLMSGTSLDGLDIALCNIENSGTHTKVEVEKFITIPYSQQFVAHLQALINHQNISLQHLCLVNNWLGKQFAIFINKALQNWGINNNEIDLIASHGQTIFHAPKSHHKNNEFGNTTLQIADADVIAFDTKIITLSDFRQKHIAAGGQGAPLAVYGDYILFASETENRILLNIGGISNCTILPKNNLQNIETTDIGPGNILMNLYIQKHFAPLIFDGNGSLAQQGNIIDNLLKTLLETPFLQQPFSKTTGAELFNLQLIETAIAQSNTSNYSHGDIICTLNMFTAITIANAIIDLANNQKFSIYISGGGVHNKTLINNIQQLLPNFSIKSTQNLGINSDAKEAVLFAILANECICGNNLKIGNNINLPAVSMGKISLP